MNEIRNDHRRTPCPSDLELASFVDGDLTTEARAAIVKHVAWCDDCREILATVAASVEARHAGATPTPAAGSWLRRRGLAVGLAATIAAGLAASLLLTPRRAAEATEWRDLTAALGPARTVDARLSGQTRHVERASPTRSASPPPPSEANFALESLAAHWRELADTEPTATHLHMAGVAALALGQSDDAVRLLVRVAATAGASAAVFADLSAAFAARAATPGAAQGDDWTNALTAAQGACERDPALAAAWFNRAVALEGLRRRVEARQAWLDYTTRFPAADGWHAEALRRMNAPSP